MRRKHQNPNIDKSWFQHRMDERRLTIRGMAKQLGTSPSTVSLMLRGISKIPETFLPQLADMFGVDSVEILKRAGAPLVDQKRTVPVAFAMLEDRTVVKLSEDEQFVTAAPFDTRTSGFGVQIRAPGIYERWIVYGSGQKMSAAKAAGHLCVYQNTDGKMYIAVLKAGFKPGTYDSVSAFNDGTVVSDVQVDWAMPVTWIKPAAISFGE